MIFWGKAIYYTFALLDLQALFGLNLQNTLFYFHLYQIPVRMKIRVFYYVRYKKPFQAILWYLILLGSKIKSKENFWNEKPLLTTLAKNNLWKENICCKSNSIIWETTSSKNHFILTAKMRLFGHESSIITNKWPNNL